MALGNDWREKVPNVDVAQIANAGKQETQTIVNDKENTEQNINSQQSAPSQETLLELKIPKNKRGGSKCIYLSSEAITLLDKYTKKHKVKESAVINQLILQFLK